MASKKDKIDKHRFKLPVAKMLPWEKLLQFDYLDVEKRKLNEIADLLCLPNNLSEHERNARVMRALDLYKDLSPGDGLEGMLSAQMVGTHFAALECLHRAAVPDQTFAGRDMALKHAQKLMSLYTQQLAALDKHRGKGQQKVTVEYVHVEAGGQAIVGNVEAGARVAKDPTGAAALENTPEVPIEPVTKKTTAKRGKG
jgi:hypothetical protein